MAIAYWRTYNLPIVITNTMNDALLFISKQQPNLYSECVKIGKTGDIRPDRYNICGDTELNNLELAQMVAEIMGKNLNYILIPSESARPGYDIRYALDGSKMAALGWKQPFTFRESLERIVRFTIKNPHWLI